ncbi:hypothetical protein T4B_6970 [Trichinella pseudospiralis]|uniref:Uncharacterized protein n=1 Tax=Trichinella pseudospiralis TaxID=6337 RepID=A0A0V1IV61_TRIPS|nr:hypothetical protein T4B_6970 [Trichinella pseudospiralis]
MTCDLIMRLDWMRSVTAVLGPTSKPVQKIYCSSYRWEETSDQLLVRLLCLVTEDTARALGLAGVAETLTMKGMSGIRCTPALAERVRFRLSSVKMSQHDLVGEPIEADAPTDL